MPPKRASRAPARRQALPRNLFTGHAFTPKSDPPMYKPAPWQDATVNFEDAFQSGVAYQLTPSNIRSRLLSNFGITQNAAPNFVFKMKQIAIWAVATLPTATASDVSVLLEVSALSPTVSDDLQPTAPRAVYYGLQAKLVDTGTIQRPAAVGWRYSLADQSVNIYASQQMTICEYSAGGGGYLRILVNISYSFVGTSTPTRFVDRILLSGLEEQLPEKKKKGLFDCM